MRRRSFLQAAVAILPFPFLLKNKQRKLTKGFKYLGEACYSYNKPSWIEKSGKCHYMTSMHAYHPDIDVARADPKIVTELQMRSAKENRTVIQFNNGLQNKDLAIVFHEDHLSGRYFDEHNSVMHPKDAKCRKCHHIYNSVRYFYIDRQTLEREIWS